jgi:PAS domain S-box-containing protein
MSTDPNPTDPVEAIRRDMADALAAIIYSGLPVEGESLPHLEFTNRYAEEYFGIASEVIAGDRWIELVHPDDRAGVRVAWEASRATGQHYRHEHRLKLADGKYRRFLARALPLRDDHGQVVKWYGVLTPIDDKPRLRGPRPRAAKVDYYPLCDSEGYLHLVEVTVWQDRHDNPAAKRHPSGAWYRVEVVAESVWQAPD